MTATGERHRRVAASFARQYYTLMLQQPEKLPAFYTPHATFEHLGQKAKGAAEIETTIAALYPAQPNGSVQIHSLFVESTTNNNIHVTIAGSITTALSVTYNFTHDVELTEHATNPGSFGIVNDVRARNTQEEPVRWAQETPPMFAQQPEKDVIEPLQQPAATTAVASFEKFPTTKNVVSSKKALSSAENVAGVNSKSSEPSATATTASALPECSTASSATNAVLKTVAINETEEEGKTIAPTPSTSCTNTESRKPKSFAEAIMMGKQGAGAQGTVAPLKVVAKGGKEHPVEEPVKEKKEKGRNSAAAVERSGKKDPTKNGANAKTPSTVSRSSEGVKRNGIPGTEGRNGREVSGNTNNNFNHTTNKNKNNNNNNNNNNSNSTTNNNYTSNNTNNRSNKRKDAEGRTLSRFVVFYDIIIKGLQQDATEQTVRDVLDTSAPVKLVNVLSQSDKRDPGVLRTFAFVQLDHDAIKEAGEDVKMTVAKIVSAHKGKKGPAGQRYQVDEVREKYTATPAEVSA